MEEVYLVNPQLEHKQAYFELLVEYEEANERIHPGVFRLKGLSYEEWLDLVESYKYENTCPKNLVPSYSYFLMTEKKRMIGTIQIRHYLNEQLFKYDGHIGAGIRPTERRKGYASKMLQMALENCRVMGLNRVLITCNKSNNPSEKTIIKNGGIFENELTEPNGNIVKRFWIDLSQ